ncbi:hypothetical protein KGY73_01925 [bacterium]|nr:hypothetical protein [bacterium]
MDQFEIGDKIIYPNQGMGVIEDIQNQNFFGIESKIYYVRIISNNTLVMVPSRNAEEMGIRKPVSMDSVEKIFDFIEKREVDLSMNWKGRYKEHLDLMKSGSLLDMALVLKSLFYLNQSKPLSFREKKMMDKAKNLITSEISEVLGSPFGVVERKIMETLSNCFKQSKSKWDS